MPYVPSMSRRCYIAGQASTVYNSNLVQYADYDGLNRARTIQHKIDTVDTDIAEYTFVGHQVATKTYPQTTSALYLAMVVRRCRCPPSANR